MELAGKSVIVTGASSGIGESFARLAASAGARLVLAGAAPIGSKRSRRSCRARWP